MSRRNVLSIAFLGTFILTPAISSADDFAPPPWLRSDPFALTAEWEFLTPANPTPPDGPLTNVFTKGGGPEPTFATITGDAGLGWGIGTGDGGWFFPDGGSIRFHMDNVTDLRDTKHLWIQITHTPGLTFDLDALPGFNMGATGSLPGPATMISHGPVSGPPLHVGTIFTWDMHPNPPWEEFRLLVHGTGEIDQIVVDTFSIPEPSSIALYSLAVIFASAWRVRNGRAAGR